MRVGAKACAARILLGLGGFAPRFLLFPHHHLGSFFRHNFFLPGSQHKNLRGLSRGVNRARTTSCLFSGICQAKFCLSSLVFPCQFDVASVREVTWGLTWPELTYSANSRPTVSAYICLHPSVNLVHRPLRFVDGCPNIFWAPGLNFVIAFCQSSQIDFGDLFFS